MNDNASASQSSGVGCGWSLRWGWDGVVGPLATLATGQMKFTFLVYTAVRTRRLAALLLGDRWHAVE